jgi:Dullard-like phosphatase family protein
MTMRRSRSGSFVPHPAVAFDLDETLVYCTPLKPSTDRWFPIKVRKRRMFVQMRPGLLQFLSRIQRTYDVFFFTASEPEYANQIIDKIAPSVRPCRRFFRNSCHSAAGYIVKDLRIMKRSLSQTILVDNTAGSALDNPRNLIRVMSWAGERSDDLLLHRLLPMLESLAYDSDLVASAHALIAKNRHPDISGFPV